MPSVGAGQPRPQRPLWVVFDVAFTSDGTLRCLAPMCTKFGDVQHNKVESFCETACSDSAQASSQTNVLHSSGALYIPVADNIQGNPHPAVGPGLRHYKLAHRARWHRRLGRLSSAVHSRELSTRFGLITSSPNENLRLHGYRIW